MNISRHLLSRKICNMDLKQQTTDTYNSGAEALAEKFEAIGSRKGVIRDVIKMVQKENPFVVEIGAAAGRDAEEILKLTNNYLGIDVSEKFIEIARARVPAAHFEVADVDTFEFPKGIDVMISFASLLHSDKEALRGVFKRLFDAMNSGGVVCFSVKYADEYQASTKTDSFGTRTYYLYSGADMTPLVLPFKILKNEVREVRGQMWLEFLLRKD